MQRTDTTHVISIGQLTDHPEDARIPWIKPTHFTHEGVAYSTGVTITHNDAHKGPESLNWVAPGWETSTLYQRIQERGVFALTLQDSAEVTTLYNLFLKNHPKANKGNDDYPVEALEFLEWLYLCITRAVQLDAEPYLIVI